MVGGLDTFHHFFKKSGDKKRHLALRFYSARPLADSRYAHEDQKTLESTLAALRSVYEPTR